MTTFFSLGVGKAISSKEKFLRSRSTIAQFLSSPAILLNANLISSANPLRRMAYSTYTVPQLKEELKKRGMKVSGTKAELVKRLAQESTQSKLAPEKKDDEETETGDEGQEEKEEKEEKEKKEKASKKRKATDPGRWPLPMWTHCFSVDDEVPEPASKVAKLEPKLSETITDPGWKKVLEPIFKKQYYKDIERYVASERAAGPIFPPHEEVYNAFNFTPYVKVWFLRAFPSLSS